MRTLLILLASLTVASAQPTTNVYTAPVLRQGKVKQTCATGGTIWVDGTATFKNYTNGNYFFPSTNWFVFDFSNHIPMIVWNDGDGNGGCGFGHLVITDSIFPGTPVAFDLRWPTNLAIPTNPVPMTVVNLTNHP